MRYVVRKEHAAWIVRNTGGRFTNPKGDRIDNRH